MDNRQLFYRRVIGLKYAGSILKKVLRGNAALWSSHSGTPMDFEFRICGRYDLNDVCQGQGVYYVQLTYPGKGLIFNRIKRSVHLIHTGQFFDGTLPGISILQAFLAMEKETAYSKNGLVGSPVDLAVREIDRHAKSWSPVLSETADPAVQ